MGYIVSFKYLRPPGGPECDVGLRWSCWIREVLKSNVRELLRDGQGLTRTPGEKATMQPRAKEHLGPPEAGRGRKDPPLGVRREGGLADTWIWDFRPPDQWESKFL